MGGVQSELQFTEQELAEQDQEALKGIPLGEDGQPTSLGSINHDTGTCKPCLFSNSKTGCQNGRMCQFCHFPHKRKDKPRPCKGKRERYRKLIQRMEDLIEADPDPDTGRDPDTCPAKSVLP